MPSVIYFDPNKFLSQCACYQRGSWGVNLVSFFFCFTLYISTFLYLALSFNSQLDQLQEVVLHGMSMYGVGPHGNELLQHTPNIQDLDISATMVSSWLCVAEIAECLPILKSLNVRYV